MFWILGVKVYYFGIKFWSLFQNGRAAYTVQSSKLFKRAHPYHGRVYNYT